MKAFQMGSPAEQRLYLANWKNPKQRTLAEINEKQCGICEHETNRRCLHPKVNQKTLQTSVCDYYTISPVIADIRKSMTKPPKLDTPKPQAQ